MNCSPRVAVNTDLPQYELRNGDVATVAEHHPGWTGQKPGYSIEVFNASGDTLAVVTVSESQIVSRNAN